VFFAQPIGRFYFEKHIKNPIMTCLVFSTKSVGFMF